MYYLICKTLEDVLTEAEKKEQTKFVLLKYTRTESIIEETINRMLTINVKRKLSLELG